jgi:hypothetical protein
MDKPVLMFEAPLLNDETAAKVQEFLYALMDVIDEHYYPQITRHYRSKARCEYCDDVVLF